ncbi:MAG TPA: TonB-dependent receptor [Chitinophagales bacterium]|nr:TonB-dependent receptor [Chitinophagales bacterium]
MKHIFVLIALLFSSLPLFAQFPQGNKGNFNNPKFNVGHFYGRIVDAKTGKGVEFATLQLFQTRFDTVRKKTRPMLVSGALTESNGDFSLESLPVMGEYTLKITAIGYDSSVQKISFPINFDDVKNGNYQKLLSAVDKDLGNIKLNSLAIQLSEVVVSGDEQVYRMELDKKVYNVAKDPSSAGTTADELLKKIPGVNVDLDNNVTLRNASPTIFVDGRPTTLTIDQIPSDVIEKIEVITNPSAKYDASGGQAGIINIVMKKNHRIGYNGGIRAGIDKRGKINFGGDINLRQGKVNVFAAGNFNQRKSISYNSTDRYNLIDSPLTNIFQKDTVTSKNHFAFGSLGFDYFLNNRNTITLSGNYVQGKFDPVDNIHLSTDTLLPSSISTSNAIRYSNNARNFQNFGGALSFKHLFPKDGQDWTADLNYNQSKSDGKGFFTTQYYDDAQQPLGNLIQQQQNGSGANRFFTAQTDVEDPLSDSMKIEAGARAALREFTSENHVLVFDDSAQQFIEVPDLNNYKFDDQVYAAYFTFSNKIKKLRYQAGLRVESSFYTGTLTDVNESFKNNFPVSLFPSGFLSYELSSTSDLQLNYSRKIDRPGFYQLMPFTDYSDSLNLQRGNPDLKPQFTNTIEFSFEKNFDHSNSILTSAYFKNTNNLMTRFQELQFDSSLNNDVIINTYVNANSSYLYGVEITSTNSIKKWFTISVDVNVYDSYINGKNIESDLTNQQLSWFAKLNSSFKLPKNFTIQLTGDYQSKAAIPQGSGGGGGGGGRMFGGGGGGGFGGGSPSTLQGYIKPVYGVDLSFKKDFLKAKAASITLSFSDIFRTRKYITFYDTDFFMQTSSRFRDPQFVRLNFSFRFGKFDTSLFKRKNLRGNTDMMQDIPQQ